MEIFLFLYHTIWAFCCGLILSVVSFYIFLRLYVVYIKLTNKEQAKRIEKAIAFRKKINNMSDKTTFNMTMIIFLPFFIGSFAFIKVML